MMSIKSVNVRAMHDEGQNHILFQIAVTPESFNGVRQGIREVGLRMVGSSSPHLSFKIPAANIALDQLNEFETRLKSKTIIAHQSDNISQDCTTLVEAAQFVARGLKL